MKIFRLIRNRDGEKGALLIILAIMIPVLLGILGLVVDNTHLFKARRDLQSAADAGVIAAAHEIRKQNLAGFAAAAIEDVQINGATEDHGAVIQVNRPPERGRWAGDDNYVEVVVEREVPTFFMRALGRSSVEIEARSVAGLVDRNVGVYVMGSSSTGALTVASGASVQVPDCEVFVNSASDKAAITQAGASLTTKRLEVAGGYEGSGFYPDPVVNAVQISDPLEDLATPSYSSGCDYYDTVTVRETKTLSPGVYCGGIDVVDNGKAIFSSGLYVLRGGGLRVGKKCDPQDEEVQEDDQGDSDHGDSDGGGDHGDSGRSGMGRGRGGGDQGDSDGGREDQKVTICHEQSQRFQTIEIDSSALSSHLAHGDSVGECSDLCEAADDGDSDQGDSDSDQGDSDSDQGDSGQSDSDGSGMGGHHGDSDGSGMGGDHGDSGGCHGGQGDSDSDGSESDDSEPSCQAKLEGSGVTFFLTDSSGCGYGPVEIDSSATVDLSAPTSGSLAGVLFYQDRDIDSGATSVLVSSSTSEMKGVVYFPTTNVDLYGGTIASSQPMKIVANGLTVHGKVTLACPEADSPFNPTALRRITLSE